MQSATATCKEKMQMQSANIWANKKKHNNKQETIKMKKIDVTTLGEILIDFTFSGINSEGKNTFEENPGGAPANCACAIGKLGGKAAFIGMTGKDSFGKDLRETLIKNNVNVEGLKTTASQHTTLAFVTIDKSGERNFSFCRNPGADTQLTVEDLETEIINSSKIFHIGSLSLTDEPAKSTTMFAIKTAKLNGALISYDPNWRPSLWAQKQNPLESIKEIFSRADIVKVSEEESQLLFGTADFSEAAEKIMNLGPQVVMVTLGSNGVYYRAKNKNGNLFKGNLAAKKVQAVDTTGAGDSFTGAFLYRITRRTEPLDFTQEQLEQDLNFANATAALCVTKRGGIPALPELNAVKEFLTKN